MESQNLLILTTNPRLYACTQLEAAINEATHSCRFSDPYSVSDKELAWADVVINRNTGLNYNDDDLEKMAILGPKKVINPVTCSRVLRDKYQQWLHFKEILGPSQLIETYSLTQGPDDANKQNKWVIKTTRGQQAKGVYPSTDIINDRKKLIVKGDLNYIIQPYIELKSEWRVLLFKGISSKKVEKIIIRKLPKITQNDFHILNFASSSCEIIEEDKTPQQVLSIADAVAGSLDFYFISVDVLEESEESEEQGGGHRLIEVNGCPGMAHSDEILLTSKHQMTMAQLFTEKVINS
ncbi:hypothetical protein ABMA79_11025 [Halobacteriovorax sp. HFRX-2_2]|uniref:ATP-grasp domain-containing protein n=1 Tax=unclassified Halobacteriovorax TaxID=2639665 RepID=UPI003712849B